MHVDLLTVSARQRLAAAVAVLIVGLMLALTLSPAPAGATASGCTQLGGWKTDAVCVHATGDNLYVKRARASYVAPFGRPCNTRMYITFYDLSNRKYDQRVSGLQSGCAAIREFWQTYNRKMRPGRVCGAVSINGVLKPGACVSVF
jgi:hypothetical protein